MSTNSAAILNSPSRQYYSRPADETFNSIQAWQDAAQFDKDHCKEAKYAPADLTVEPTEGNTGLQIRSARGPATFTHWSFGQAARLVGAPAEYLRSLPPPIAADAMNFGLKARSATIQEPVNLLVKANGSAPIVRAVTSDTYSRVWDATIGNVITDAILSHDPQWGLPPVWGHTEERPKFGGAYRSDRDSYLLIVNGGSIVTDPSRRNLPGEGRMYRGLICRNSETGAASLTIDQFLYAWICGNLMIWGGMVESSYRRRHVGAINAAMVQELGRFAYKFAQASPARDEAIIRAMIDHELAQTADGVVAQLRTFGATKEQAELALAACEREEPQLSPRSLWGVAQGLTRVSQQTPYQDERFAIDQIAALVMQRGRALVAA